MPYSFIEHVFAQTMNLLRESKTLCAFPVNPDHQQIFLSVSATEKLH